MAEATLRTLFERLGRPPTEADIRIARAGVDAPMPWYVQVMVGIGAWLAALAIIVAVVLVLTETLGIDDPEAAMAAVGGILFAIGLFAGRGGSGVFRQQFAVALALGGLLVAVVGLAVMVERFEVAAAGSVLATVVVVALRRAGVLQFLAASLACGLVAAALFHSAEPYEAVILTPVTLAAGLALLLRPVRRFDLRPSAYALLLTAPALQLEIFGLRPSPWGTEYAWAVSALHVAAMAWMLTRLWQALPARDAGPAALWVAIAAAVVAGLLLPPGGTASLFLMLLAFVVASWPLAVLGALGQVLFVGHFYYILTTTLLVKSLLMTAAGLVLLAAWYALTRWRRSGPAAEAPP